MRNKLVKRIAALLCVAVMGMSVVACGGGSNGAAQEEYEAKATELGNSLNSAMTDAAALDPNDVEGAKEFIEGLKAPFVEFSALKAPAKYADAHAKFQSGCDAMVEYLDMCIAAMDSGDVDMEKMTSLLTTIQNDFTEGASMLE